MHFYKHFMFQFLFFISKWCINFHYLGFIAINQDGTRLIRETGGHFLISLQQLHRFIAMSQKRKNQVDWNTNGHFPISLMLHGLIAMSLKYQAYWETNGEFTVSLKLYRLISINLKNMKLTEIKNRWSSN